MRKLCYEVAITYSFVQCDLYGNQWFSVKEKKKVYSMQKHTNEIIGIIKSLPPILQNVI